MSDRNNATAALADVAAEPGVAKPDPLLVADNVQRSFGGLHAVDVDHLEIQRGAITALIGPNGAGKTTLFNVLTGFDRGGSGDWRFEGKKMSRLPAHRVAHRGMVRTFQLTKALSRLTVLENLQLGATEQRGEAMFASVVRPLWRRQERAIIERADALLARFRLDHLRDEFAGTLSGGQRKLLELARALMVQPRMLMLDEPMAGVNPALTQSLLEHITDLRDEGTTICFVEHDMDMVMGTSDWVVCLAEGQVIAEGPPQAIGSNPAVIDAYLGKQHGAPPAEELTS
ncbi:branched-chain amino acid transport system ATP-binding protein [Haloechinothrix alba]|uniref:Branched-chain amino acid transport system ATP-binding protein n=1 Tax=Haloechinothrix alba TaxID=664784 RepID=A0A239AIV2_9PSEU|nr:ABC transporter ATP-binding protein [Haloechinothrix alba]SNR95469.1 branched-chain amino acid transport system ATP-binding protein [Haloechinothrix alba]